MAPAAESAQLAFHPDIVKRVAHAVASFEAVVVGMSINPSVKKARQALEQAGIPFEYIELGGYHNMWKERLAVKMWSGWPTYPQVFINGWLVGGNTDLRAALADGSVQRLREAPRP